VSLGRTLVIVNPQARHGATRELLPAVEQLLASVDHETVVTETAGQATEIAAAAEGFSTVAAVGGDGTVHEILNGLMRRPVDARPALALLPTGSGDDYARTLGISRDLATAVRQIATGEVRRLDVGVCNGTYFANSISMGFDAKVTARAVEMKLSKGRSGLPLYLSAMLDVLLHDFGSHRVRLTLDGAPAEERDILLLAVTNGPTYGGGFRIVPAARPNDGALDACLIDALPLHSALWRFPFVVVGRHAWMRQVHFSQHRHIVLESEVALPGQIDGEVMLAERYDISILPAALGVIVGRSAG
jgi:YegS/Rv2252/BmrU family lipid kinase